MVDANGIIGWAPASYLVPVDEEDLEETAENEQLVPSEKGMYTCTPVLCMPLSLAQHNGGG